MPQMAPLNWTIMFLFFNMYFIMFSIMNFFQLSILLKSKKNKLNSKMIFWKW